MQRLHEYTTLLNLFSQLVQSQATKPIADGDEWQNDAQTLSIKLFRHLVSMQTLAAGTTVDLDGKPFTFFIDHASIKVVARAALETYLVFFYLYGTPNASLSKFRHSTWRLGGLTDRQQFHASTEENREALVREKDTIKQIKQSIEAMPEFQGYSIKQQAKLLEGKWRIGNGWVDLSLAAGFHKKYFQNIYGYLCGYSHSSYLSALQVGQAQMIEDQKMLTESILGIGIMLMAHFAFIYSAFFKSANRILENNPDQKKIAQRWRFGVNDMASIYDGKDNRQNPKSGA
jgi:Family of unknown function (DUF5677)